MQIFIKGRQPRRMYYSGGKECIIIIVKKMGAIINGLQGRFALSEITETENHFNLYLKAGDEVHFWKVEPKNQFVAVEFFLD